MRFKIEFTTDDGCKVTIKTNTRKTARGLLVYFAPRQITTMTDDHQKERIIRDY